MRIAFFLEQFPKLSEAFILNQITALLDAKIDVTIFAKYRNPQEKIHEKFLEYDLDRFIVYEPPIYLNRFRRLLFHAILVLRTLFHNPFLFVRLFGFQGKLFSIPYLYASMPLLKKRRFDVLHAHFGPVGLKVLNLQKLGVVEGPIVCSFHGYDVDRIDFRENPFFYKNLFDKASRITGNSNYTLNNIQLLGCPFEKLVLLPESLNCNYFKRNNSRRQENSLVQIISVARLVEFKGIKYAILALSELIKDGIENVHFSIVGSGPLEIELRKLVSELGLNQYVTFLGGQSQKYVLELMENSDIFLLPGITSTDGRQENQGLVLQEAQAMELPVIASSIGGVPEGVVDGVTAFLVSERDYIGICVKLKLLIENPDLRREMGIKGRSFVRKKFDSEILGKRLVEVYSEVMVN